MPKPKGGLTPPQLEVMEVVWSAGPEGAGVAEIWDVVGRSRRVARTTVLTVIQRLEQRHWLRRLPSRGASRYVANAPRDNSVGQVADEFIRDFFDGSASQMVRSLLGSGRLKPAEVNRLRALLNEAKGEGDKP